MNNNPEIRTHIQEDWLEEDIEEIKEQLKKEEMTLRDAEHRLEEAIEAATTVQFRIHHKWVELDIEPSVDLNDKDDLETYDAKALVEEEITKRTGEQ